jgi:uncharacterized SAM-binding protein YcdF (DUF218 family)
VFFFISKLLAFALKPLFWVGLILAIALWPRCKAVQRKLVGTALFIFMVCGNAVLVNEWALNWEGDPADWPKRRLKVAVVLGGYSEFDSYRNLILFNESAERYKTGLQVLLSRKAEKLILSGGSAEILNTPYHESYYIRKSMGDFGLDTTNILFESISRNTFENGIQTKKILDSLKLREPILLITSASHMPRSVAIFHKLGIETIPYPVHFMGNRSRVFPLTSWFIPQGESFDNFETLLRELIGTTVYRITGKL